MWVFWRMLGAQFKCEYSGHRFHLCAGSVYSWSVERVDPKLKYGYGPRNCVLILQILNVADNN